MKKTLTAAFAVASLVALVGCSTTASGAAPVDASKPSASSAPAAPAAPVAAIGVPLMFKQNDGEAKVTIESATYGASDGGEFSGAPKNGGYLILDVLWEAASGKATANPLYVTAKDASGHAGELDLFVPSALASGEVPVGDKARGNVAFDIAPGPVTIILTNQGLQEAARLTVTPTAR